MDLFLWVEAHLNYWWITILMAIESSFIPFPSEVVVPPAAYFASTPGSNLNIVLVVVFATIGALIGALFNYYLAIWIGRPLVYKFVNSRFGHICLLDEEKIQKAEAYFDKHGAISTFIGRLIPGIRQLISIPAGLARMNIGKFLIFTTLGAGIWNAVLATLGWWLSTFIPKDRLYHEIEHYNQYLTWAGYGLALIVVIFIVYHALKKKANPTSSLKE